MVQHICLSRGGMRLSCSLRTATLLAFAILAVAPRQSLAAGRPGTARIGQHEHINLSRFAKVHRMRLNQHSADHFTLDGGGKSIIFHPGHRRVSYDGIDIYLNGEIQNAFGGWYLSKVDIDDIINPIIAPEKHLAEYRCEVVVIDPGHGGSDPGAVSPNGLLEKDLALDISRRVADILRAEGLEVHLTRDDDRFLQLDFRPRIAKNKNADIFVSIHVNASPNGTARGVETYRLTATDFPSIAGASEAKFASTDLVGNGYNGANTLLGMHVQRSLQKATGSPDRGLRHARYAVLRDSDCPAVLVECGFICNPEEESLLRTAEYRAKIASGIADGILLYRLDVSETELSCDVITESSEVAPARLAQ